jgi:hypothetical protein
MRKKRERKGHRPRAAGGGRESVMGVGQHQEPEGSERIEGESSILLLN